MGLAVAVVTGPEGPTQHVSRVTLLAKAREGIRDVERFAHRLLSETTGEEGMEASRIMSLAIGLRRKLEALEEVNGE